MNQNYAFRSLLFSAVILAGSATAQTRTDSSRRSRTLDTVTISTVRSTVNRSKVPRNITVIDRKSIELTPQTDMTDILKKNSSVNVIQYPGLSSGVSIRGFRPQFSGLNQRTLLLVDGRPAGTANLSTINNADIERIEILKGPASALYGSQAMGGVVNVITRKSAGKIKNNISAEYGSYETYRLSGTSGGNITSRLDYDLSFNIFDRNKNMKLGNGNLFRKALGSDIATINYKSGNQDISETVNDSRSDGLRREYTRLKYDTQNLRLGYRFAKDWRIDAKAERFNADGVESPSDIFYGNARPSSKDIEKYNGEISVSGKLNKHNLFLRAYQSEEENANRDLQSGGVFFDPFISFISTTQWSGIQLKDVYTFGRQSVVLGVDYNIAAAKSRSFTNVAEKAPFSPNSELSSLAGYVQGQFMFADQKVILNPGARYDLITYDVKATNFLSNYTPGKERNPFFSPSIAMQVAITERLKFHESAGRSFVTPDAYNVAGYSENIVSNKANVTQGNPDLENESSTSWDAGFRYNSLNSRLFADFTYFHTEVQNRITTSRLAVAPGEKTASGREIGTRSTYINANEADINGFEFEFWYDLGDLEQNNIRLFADVTRNLRAREVTINQTTKAETYRDIYNVAKFTGNFGLEYRSTAGINMRLGSRYVGKRKDTDFSDARAPEIVYPSFMTVDFGGSYFFKKRHTIGLTANNITDENYYEKRGFNLQGRSFLIKYGINF